MSVDVRHMVFFQRGCTHLYICMKNCSWLVHMRKRFLLQKIEYILDILVNCRMDIVDQCSIVLLTSVFDCHTNAFILKVHLMRLMHPCRHTRAPLFLPQPPPPARRVIITIPPSQPLPPIHSPPFLPLERVSLSNSTDAHT